MIAVTGAAGFVGGAYCRHAAARGLRLRRFVRLAAAGDGAIAIDLSHADVDALARGLEGVDALVHLAGRAHAMEETASDSAAAYRLANAETTERLAQAAVRAGVQQFIFASTVKVNGEVTPRGRPFRPSDAPVPQDAYARSKLAAERALARIAAGTPMATTVLRLPLVYGPGARGNFRRLVDAVAARRWLPFGAIDNRRSLCGLASLLDAIDAVLDAPRAAAGTHFVADADSVSTPALVRAIAAALGVAPRLLPVPVAALRMAGAVLGRRPVIERLTQSLEVDTESLAAATRWRARPFAIDAATVAPPGAAASTGPGI